MATPIMGVLDPSAVREVSATGANAPGPLAGLSAAGASASGETDRLRVLVVDDEPTLRTVIAQVLRLPGFDATEADSAEQALVEFRARPFPVVITDIVVGGMSGLDLLRELKAIDRETMVVVMTSQASLEAATTALRGGAYDFLVKPLDDLIMVSAVVQRAGEALAPQARNRFLSSQLEVYARELERLNVSLKDMADRDWLTGLANRRRLRSVLDSELALATRHGLELSILMLDVDHFDCGAESVAGLKAAGTVRHARHARPLQAPLGPRDGIPAGRSHRGRGAMRPRPLMSRPFSADIPCR